MTLTRLLASGLALACALPAQAAETSFEWRAVGQAAGSYATDPPPRAERWDAFAGYGVTGDFAVTTDSGLKLGLTATIGSGDYEKSLDRPGNNEKVTLSELFLDVTSAYGRVKLGDEDGAAKRAVDLLPILVGGQMDGFWTRMPGARPPQYHLGRDSDDATKILYETPRLAGARAGLSYAPERDSLVEDIKEASLLPAEEDFWELGLNYRGDAGAWSYELAAGYGRGQSDTPGIADTESVKLAGLLLYGGFSLGALWYDDGDSGRPTGRFDTSGYTLQGTYENGPYGATLFWHDSEAEGLADYRAYGLGLSWRVRETMTLGLDLVRVDNDLATPARGQDGWVGTLVAEVRF